MVNLHIVIMLIVRQKIYLCGSEIYIIIIITIISKMQE